MKVYKYRDFCRPEEDDFRRLEDLVHRHRVWCARADTLNDPEEFIWQCDYTATSATADLLAAVLVKARGRTPAEARAIVKVAIQSGRLRNTAHPVVIGMIEQCRNEVGLSCFGTAPNNDVLWKRYGGDGAGVCVEFDVPDDLLGTQIHCVQYLERKRLHVDQLLRSFVDRNQVKLVYDLALLAKPNCWAPEKEVRFVSQRHSILVALDRARVPQVLLGHVLRHLIRWSSRSSSAAPST